MRVVADSHAIVWHLQGSARLSAAAARALIEAEATDGVVVSIATLIDLWYVTQTTRKLTDANLIELRDRLDSSRYARRPVGPLYRGDCPSVGTVAGHQRWSHPRKRARADHLVGAAHSASWPGSIKVDRGDLLMDRAYPPVRPSLKPSSLGQTTAMPSWASRSSKSARGCWGTSRAFCGVGLTRRA